MIETVWLYISASTKKCSCYVSGDPHYYTADDQVIHFMGTCKYILSTNKPGSNLTYFAVEVKNEHRYNTIVSYTRMVDLKLKGVTVRLLPRNKILVNSIQVNLPLEDFLGFSAHFSAGVITITTKWGLYLTFDGDHRVHLVLPGRFANELTGICGDCNGMRDDFKTKAGEDVSNRKNKYAIIGDSYQVCDDSDKPEKCVSQQPEDNCSPTQVKGCDILSSNLFKTCVDKIGQEKLNRHLESCKFDVCAYLKQPKLQSVLCKTLESMADECEDAGIFIDWRKTAKCVCDKPVDVVFLMEASAIGKLQFEEIKSFATSFLDFFTLSLYSVGLRFLTFWGNSYTYIHSTSSDDPEQVLETAKLLPYHNQSFTSLHTALWFMNSYRTRFNFRYPLKSHTSVVLFVGSKLNYEALTKERLKTLNKFGFNIYIVGIGENADEKQLQNIIGQTNTSNLMLVKSFYDLNKAKAEILKKTCSGHCDLQLIPATMKQIHARMEENVSTKIPPSFVNVLRIILADFVLKVNEEEYTLPVVKFEEFEAYYAVGWITVKTEWGLTVKYDGNQRVTVSLPISFANKLTGICGDCNGKQDDLRTKAGRDVSSLTDKDSLIANSYQVAGDSNEECNATSVVNIKCNSTEMQRCNIIHSSIFTSCVQTLGQELANRFFESCQSDVCSSTDSVNTEILFCKSIEAFVTECERAGVPISWRGVARCRVSLTKKEVGEEIIK
ncbi:Hypothetical predicted protein [Octopus vulgaris]|uniref:VWFD domain-containing protein n=1 Tax=Octopus vulgaris TaxID=6645 RepID=A0AA36EYL1_OCTVU|nr:Hypothetical predicted protein [Octopus vulgaris]